MSTARRARRWKILLWSLLCISALDIVADFTLPMLGRQGVEADYCYVLSHEFLPAYRYHHGKWPTSLTATKAYFDAIGEDANEDCMRRVQSWSRPKLRIKSVSPKRQVGEVTFSRPFSIRYEIDVEAPTDASEVELPPAWSTGRASGGKDSGHRPTDAHR